MFYQLNIKDWADFLKGGERFQGHTIAQRYRVPQKQSV